MEKKKIQILVHILPDELCLWLERWSNLFAYCAVLRGDVVGAATGGDVCAKIDNASMNALAVFAQQSINTSVAQVVRFLELNPDWTCLVDPGSLTKEGLEQTAINLQASNGEELKLIQRSAREFRGQNPTGVWVGGQGSKASKLYPTLRYSPGAALYYRAGGVLRGLGNAVYRVGEPGL